MTIDYGTDWSCMDDVGLARTVTGVELVVQAVYRRVTTKRGTLLSSENYGIDVRDFVQDEQTPAKLAAIPSLIQNEIEKDDRVGAVAVAAEFTVDGSLHVRIAGRTTNDEPFRLKLKVTELDVQLLKEGA